MTEYRKVMVTGSRDWPLETVVHKVLFEELDIAMSQGKYLVLVHGDCPEGADFHAHNWKSDVGRSLLPVEESRYPANWALGKQAGFIRNKWMIDQNPDTDLVLAFIKDDSNGASMTRDLALKACLDVDEWTYKEPARRNRAA